MRFFFDYTLGLRPLGWALLIALTVTISCWLYTGMQVELQRRMFDAVQSVDVLGTFCGGDPALADGCTAVDQQPSTETAGIPAPAAMQAPGPQHDEAPVTEQASVVWLYLREVQAVRQEGLRDSAQGEAGTVESPGEADEVKRLSDQVIWHLLREAQLVDTQLVEWPGALRGNAVPETVRALREFLSEPERARESGVALLAAAAEVCGSGRPYVTGGTRAESDAAWRAMIARLIAGTGKEAAEVEDVSAYLAVPATPDAVPLPGFRPAEAMRWRFAVPRRVPDARLVAALVGFSGAFRPDDPDDPQSLAQGLSLKRGCTAPLLGLSSEEFSQQELYAVAIGRIEFALWVASQIRRDGTVASAAADAALYTGPEQFGILTVFTFGVLLAMTRLLCMIFRHWRGGLTVGPTRDRTIDPALKRLQAASASEWGHWRAQLTHRIASARWPLPTAAVLLPALGFVGTVRGIKNSLAGADGLVFADNLNERADAIGALAGDLGLAFGTTLLALLGSMVLTILLAIEGRLIDLLILRQLDTAPRFSEPNGV